MQRHLFLKQASSIVAVAMRKSHCSSSWFHNTPYKTLSSVAKPSPVNHFLSSPSLFQLQRHFFSPRPKLSLAEEILGLLSYPVVVKRPWLNSLNIHLLNCRAWFLRFQLPKRRFDFAPQRNQGRSWVQRFTENDIILGLLITNVCVFLLWRIADQKFMMDNFTVSLDNFKSGRLHTLITSAFSHIDIEHIVSNMIGLYFFGLNIGRLFGPEYLLKLYVAGAIGGSVFFLVHHAFLALSSKEHAIWMMDPSKTPGLGASGAVNAIMLLGIFLNPKATIYLDFIIPVPAMLLGIFLIGKDMLRIIEGNSHISGSAHLGGAAVAVAAWARLRRRRF